MNLHPKPVVEAEIPTTYFSTIEQDVNTSALVEILSSVPNSPLTPGGIIQNFTPTFPNSSFQNQFGNRTHDFSNLTPANLRYHALQQQVLQQQVNNQTFTSNLATGVPQTYSNVSPRSSNSNTSGYLSQSSHIGSLNISGSSNSLEHLYPPYKPLNQNGNRSSHYHQSDNKLFVAATHNMPKFPNDNGSNSFETENRLLTPNYHSVREIQIKTK